MDLFRALDKDRSGSITKEEFIEGAFLLPEIDGDRLSELLAARISVHMYM